MKKINTHNYEIYFLDYFEEKLAQSDIRDLFVFLNENPNLKEEFYDFEIIQIEKELIQNPNKKQLIVDENIDHEIIAFIENDLTPEKQAIISERIKESPIYTLEYQAYTKTILQPEYIPFKTKNALKKRIFMPFYYYGIAATFLLFFGLVFYFTSQTDTVQIHTMYPKKIAHIGNKNINTKLLIFKEKNISLKSNAIQNTELLTINETDRTRCNKNTKLSSINKYAISQIPIISSEEIFVKKRFVNIPDLKQIEQNELNFIGAVTKISKGYLRNIGRKVFKKNAEILEIDLVESIVQGYNTLSNSNIRITKIKDNNDKVLAVYLSSDTRRLFKYKKK